jgi:lysophospholipase L1-like esterase
LDPETGRRVMNQHSKGYRGAGRVVLVSIGILVALVCAEVGLRLALGRYLNPFEPDDTVGFRLKPNFDGRYPWTPLRTNAQGFRVSASQATPSQRTILFVGDSVTFGFGILAEDSYPTRFGERIGRPGDIVNASVPGYNLEQVVRTIRRVVQENGKPELIVYGLCLNDIGSAQGISRYEDIDPHARRARGGGLFSRSLLLSVVRRRLDRLRPRPAPVGPPSDKEDLLRDFAAPDVHAQLASFDSEWAELEDLRRTLDVPIVVVVLPYRQQLAHPDWQAPQQYLQRKCATSPLRCLDPSTALRGHRDEALYTPTSSMHFSPRGSRLLADWLADQLRDVTPGPT